MNQAIAGSRQDRIHSQQPWRFLDTGYGDPFFNMALDEAIVRAVQGAQTPSTVRVYGWRPAAVSLGYFQRALEILDLQECARQGVPVVRRLTGGRAVFHHQEITYSVIAVGKQFGAAVSILDVYRRIGTALVAALEQLGVRAQLSRMRSGGQGRRTGPGSAQPCFSSAGRYEVVVDGRKLVGSAQRWLDGVVLQHGSLLLGPGHARLATLLPRSKVSGCRRVADRLVERTISLDRLLSREISFGQVSAALRSGFAAVLDDPLEPGQVSPAEEVRTRALVRERYGRLEWTLRA